jgi:poly(3-hydroxybutyrate) depolymerase
MRAGLVPLLLALGCSASTPVELPEPLPMSCPAPVDGGVFVTGVGTPSPGCNATPAPTGLIDLAQSGWLRAGGLLSVPPSSGSSPLPVVFVFHGAGGTGDEIRDDLAIEDAADGGAIFVYPNAPLGTWDIRAQSGDYRNVQKVLGLLADEYCIDGQRVFAAGYSAGAVFTVFLGCNAAPVFRAVGSIAGTDERFDRRCCSGALSGIFVHGDADDTIPVDQGRTTRDDFLTRDGCSQSSVRDSPYCVSYSGCAPARAVDWCEHQAGHWVPPWAGSELWRFFAQFP